MTMRHVLISGLLSLASLTAYAADTTPPLTIKELDHFMDSIQGIWNGRAIETPVGPVGYDISFHSCNPNKVAGIAELQASNHHWQFLRSDDELKLTFLSTFRGNQSPIQLKVRKTEENTIHFYAPKLDLLTVTVTPLDQHIDLRIFHHHQPHVYILLKNSNQAIAEAVQVKNKKLACKDL